MSTITATGDLLFTIYVEHPCSGETMVFLGQGRTVSAAIQDGINCINETFRPREGLKRPAIKIAVTTKAGVPVLRTLAEFETGAADSHSTTKATK